MKKVLLILTLMFTAILGSTVGASCQSLQELSEQPAFVEEQQIIIKAECIEFRKDGEKYKKTVFARPSIITFNNSQATISIADHISSISKPIGICLTFIPKIVDNETISIKVKTDYTNILSYSEGKAEIQESVLEADLICNNKESVYLGAPLKSEDAIILVKITPEIYPSSSSKPPTWR